MERKLTAEQAVGKYEDTNKLTYVIVFDSPRSVANKVKYAMSRGLGGVWAYNIGFDDFSDFPNAPSSGSSQLLRAINSIMELPRPLWNC